MLIGCKSFHKHVFIPQRQGCLKLTTDFVLKFLHLPKTPLYWRALKYCSVVCFFLRIDFNLLQLLLVT